MSEPKREPKAGDLWYVGASILFLYDSGNDELGNVIVGEKNCILGGTQGKHLVRWLKDDGRFLCNLSKMRNRIDEL